MSCEEGLCAECYDHHRAIKASRNHSTVLLENFKPLEQFISTFKTDCSVHDSPFELYCPCHEEPCCTKCASLSHPNCVGITLFHKFVSELKKSAQLEDLDSSIGTLLENIDTLIENRESNLKEIEKPKNNLNMVEVKTEIDQYLKIIEMKLKAQYKNLHQEQTHEIHNVLKKLLEKRKEISDYKNNLSQLKLIGTDCQVFHGSKKIEETIVKEAVVLNKMLEEPSMQEISFKMKKKNNLEEIVSTLYDVGIDRRKPTLYLKDITSQTACQTKKEAGPFASSKSSTRTVFENEAFAEDSDVCSIVVLQDGLIAVSDFKYKRLVLFGDGGMTEGTVGTSGSPFGLTTIQQDKFAVSLPLSHEIIILDTETYEILWKIDTHAACWGLHFSDGTFITALRAVEIAFLELHGEIFRSFPMKQKNLVYVYKHNDRHFRTEFENNTIHCYNGRGHKVWQFFNEDALGPRNICTDAAGNLFVACKDSNCVIIISSDGKRYQKVVEIKRPKSIYFNERKSKLYACSDNGRSFISFILPQNIL
ncbi:uncharacterized protein LOC134710232 isoform X2 [Mytilus trossulus]